MTQSKWSWFLLCPALLYLSIKSNQNQSGGFCVILLTNWQMGKYDLHQGGTYSVELQSKSEYKWVLKFRLHTLENTRQAIKAHIRLSKATVKQKSNISTNGKKARGRLITKPFNILGNTALPQHCWHEEFISRWAPCCHGNQWVYFSVTSRRKALFSYINEQFKCDKVLWQLSKINS